MLPVLIDGAPARNIDASDRGLAYGDGVFETILVDDSVPVWWNAHLARLQRGCEVLGIRCPAADLLRDDVARLTVDHPRVVVKLIVTRGKGGRGYSSHGLDAPTRIVSLHPFVPAMRDHCEHGIEVRWCGTRLAMQPALAGIKHLNRLEQVLARREWHDHAIGEGLMCDTDGRVVCATAANLFLVREGRLATAPVQRCGIAGTGREWLLDRASVDLRDLGRSEVETADELFLVSSLRGILPIARLDGCRWTVGPMTRRLQHALWLAVPALSPVEDATP